MVVSSSRHSDLKSSIVCTYLAYAPQETDTADKGMGDDTSSTTALLESASLGCGEGERERERERSETSPRMQPSLPCFHVQY